MRPETAIIEIHGQYRIHTEFYGNPSAQQTIILVNGSLSTTASFAQTVKYLQPHYNVVLYDQPYAGQSKPHNENRTPISKECEARILQVPAAALQRGALRPAVCRPVQTP